MTVLLVVPAAILALMVYGEANRQWRKHHASPRERRLNDRARVMEIVKLRNRVEVLLHQVGTLEEQLRVATALVMDREDVTIQSLVEDGEVAWLESIPVLGDESA